MLSNYYSFLVEDRETQSLNGDLQQETKGNFIVPMRNLHPNSYLMPGFDPSQISDLLEEQFHGEGGAIEYTGLYINPSSASRWNAVANQASYQAVTAGPQYQEIAKHIQHYFLQGIETLDIFALGSGDGKSETQLTQHLLPYVKETNLLLLDVSQPLLKRAYSHALSVLGPKYKEHIFAVLGNMHHLAQASYVDLYTPQARESRRLITMLGFTFGNLDAELLFVRNSLRGFAEGDLLLLDLASTFAPAEKPEEVKRLDPSLTGKLSPGWEAAYEAFLSDTIHHYCHDIKKIHFFKELDYGTCSVPGSYAIVLRAKLQLNNGKERTFTMYQYKRHDINKLVEVMENEGWRSSNGWRYGEKPYGQNLTMYLFEKYR